MKSSRVINDIRANDMEEEILLFSGSEEDSFEPKWVKKREHKGSVVVNFSDTSFPKMQICPKYLTKVGHGQYDDTMSMLRYCDATNDSLIVQMKEALIAFPTIKRINLYACKSGLVPLNRDNLSLEQRLQLKEIRTSESRRHLGQLSYSEFFILALDKSFQAEGKSLPPNLCVVACLGDVKNNNGKPGVSSNKRKTHYPDSYTTIDKNSSLIEINCDVFIAEYKRIDIKIKNNELENNRLTLQSQMHRNRIFFYEALRNIDMNSDSNSTASIGNEVSTKKKNI